MSNNFWARHALLQIMAGGSVYTADWYVSLVANTADFYEDPRASWEVPGSRTAYTGGWIIDPAYETNGYEQAVMNDTVIDIYPTATAVSSYVVVSNGIDNDQWLFSNRLYNYPRTIEAGNFLRFPVGSLIFTVNN